LVELARTPWEDALICNFFPLPPFEVPSKFFFDANPACNCGAALHLSPQDIVLFFSRALRDALERTALSRFLVWSFLP